ncbi:two-component system, OmpR family, phosphate regulon sensor histidine kinase PhoR [Methylobacterium phyllostachyos]|uniref:histidine kinase n=1 Tax=Methylobacterium phyllostachyos TaxID=582672 RepID=A0A1H0FB80_9HYPH|nr:ATP-binding protein [Methylobacterium phyllostachyos]SDN91816.1 two-component system, OmpR family, phosphate regulon sensor histidine kinase PhoR [Methylobacterium phyllostachyos]
MSEPLRSSESWMGAAIAAGLFALATALAGHLDLPLILSGLGAVCLGGWLGGRGRTSPPLRPAATAQRHAVAEALLAHVPDPVILVDRRTLVMEANPAARALLPALHHARPLSFALRDPEVLDGIEAVLSSGVPRRVALSTRVPLERTFEVQIGALPMPDGSGVNALLFLRDLTSARRLEAMRVDFVANASHELRTPLATLIGFIETLQGPAREDAQARERFLEIMRVQALRMTRLIDDLLSLSRIELREHVAPTAVVDLGALARQMVDAQGPPAEARGATVRFEDGAGPYRVPGDADELARVIENLIENAVKYGGGRISVGLAREDDPRLGRRIVLSVTDDGPGIPPEHIPRLTERFYRVDVASSRARGGTGLGLAIVKHSLNRHRGRLAIESTVGQGTVVRVSLPEYGASATRPAATDQAGVA